MRFLKKYTAFIVILMAFLSACHRENPVELVDRATESQDLEIDNSAIYQEPFDPYSQDSIKFFLTSDKKYFGRLTIAGSEYDTPLEHHEAALARAVFFNRTQPILFNGDTIAFRSNDGGTVSVDNLILNRAFTDILLPNLSVDTIGLQYFLFNKDGVGGRGFQYYSNHTYQWAIAGSPSLPSFQESTLSPPKLHIISPSPRDILSTSRNLPFRWEGGGESVRIIVSIVQPDEGPRPVMKLRVARNRGGVIIPSTILQLLPERRSRFLFTFSSENSSVVHVDGYPDDISVRALTSHNILLQFNR